MQRKYGYKPDLKDHRDFKYRRSFKLFLPQIVDLRPLCSPVEDQGELGSCTANALVGNMELLENQKKEAFIDLSRLFVYYNERSLEGTIGQDAGARIRDGIKTLVSLGVCPESDWPYDPKQFAMKPTPTCYQEAVSRRISLYQRLAGSSDMLNCLAGGFPVVFGITIYQSFESDAVAQTGIVPMPGRDETVLGGHAVMAVGYDLSKGRFTVRNSWGVGWGDKGYFYLPFAYIDKLASDMWTIRRRRRHRRF